MLADRRGGNATLRSRRRSARWTALLLTALLMPGPASTTGGTEPAQAGRAEGTPDYMRYIHLNEYRFDPLEGTPDLPSSLRYDRIPPKESFYYLVQFKDRVTAAMKRDLESAGAVPLHYVNYNAFIVRADAGAVEKAWTLPEVRWIGPYQPAYKLGARLKLEFDAVLNRAAGPGPRIDTTLRVPVQVVTMESSSVPEVARAVEAMGGRGIWRSERGHGHVKAELPRGSLEKLAREKGVLWIDRELPTLFFNDVARWVIQSNDPVGFATPVHQHGITGTGQQITVNDSGVDYRHNAFEDLNPDGSTKPPGPTHRKVTDYYIPVGATGDMTDNGDDHGSHVSGSVAGDDGAHGVYNGDPTASSGVVGPHDGQAFTAKIEMQDISTCQCPAAYPSPDLTNHYAPAWAHGSRIHTNSWGSIGGGGSYLPQDAQTDDFVWNNEDLVVTFAGGNNGPTAGTINPYGVAKNVLAVGATGNGTGADGLAFFSSGNSSARGPAVDGRLKPDVMAPGLGVWSALGCDVPVGACTPDQYVAYSGTSMATPTTAGAAALVRQYFQDGWYPTGVQEPAHSLTPSAALVKATLINGAAEMTGTGAYDNGETRYPNNNQGWGRIQLDNSLFFRGDSRHLLVDDNRIGLATHESATYRLNVVNASVPLEVTLVWSDAARTAPTFPDLVNDLDLVVTAPDGTVYRGNRYTGFNPGRSQQNPPSPDALNNVEAVLVLPGVRTGTWTIQVVAFNVPVGHGTEQRQRYALVTTGGLKAAESAWPTFHGDNERRGVSGSTFAPPLSRQWKGSVSTSAVHGGAVFAEGKVFVGSADGYLRARDPFTGSLIWEKRLGAPDYGHAIPAVKDGVVYTTFINPYPLVYALDAQTGNVLWTFGQVPPTGAALWNTTSVVGTRLYVGTSDHRVVALNTADGSVAWLSPSAYVRVWSGAAVSGGRIVFGTEDARVVALSESNGSQQWVQTLDDGVFTVPLIADGKVFASSRAGTVYALDAATGAILWQRGAYGPLFYTTPAYDGSNIYFGASMTAGFVALNAANGAVVWQNFSVFPAESSVAYANGYVYGTTINGTLVTLAASDGSVADTDAMDVGGGSSSPATHNGWVWVQDVDGSLYAFRGVLADSDGDGESDGTDCAPSNPAIHDGAAEICNGSDDNCDGVVDEGFRDSDGDGQADCVDTDDDGDGDPDASDCSPLNAAVRHGAIEAIALLGGAPMACQDGLDNDCDGTVDLDCAIDINPTNGQIVGGGSLGGHVVSGSVADLRATSSQSPTTYEVITETGGKTKTLNAVWTFTGGLPAGQDYDLVVEGFKGLYAAESFLFSSAMRNTAGQCTNAEPNWSGTILTLDAQIDTNQPLKKKIGPLSNQVVCIRVKDSIPTGDTSPDLLTMDRLYLFPTRACADSDGDGYAPSCSGCELATCPLLDCDDRNSQVSPGLAEGPPGDPTCSDLMDNNCSSLADGADAAACSAALTDVIASSDHSTGPGTIDNPDYRLTWTVDDEREVLREGLDANNQSRLVHIWRFDNVRPGSEHRLRFIGNRPNNAENDNFQFAYALPDPNNHNLPGAFTDIQNAVIQLPRDNLGTSGFAFATGALSGRVYIMVHDTNPIGPQLNAVTIDLLAIRTFP